MTAQSANPPRPLQVAIIGGGPGGLATAIALARVPHVQVRVYEKAKVLREVGAGINIGPNTWTVLELLGVADSLKGGHPTAVVLNMNGRTGEQVHREDKDTRVARPTTRTQRTKLQSALLAHVEPGVVQLAKQLVQMTDRGRDGVELQFADGARDVVDLVVGADGIRSVVRTCAWPDYKVGFTGTTIWRALLPLRDLEAQDARFGVTGWWHRPASHVYFSPVGDGLGEIAAREYQDPAVYGAGKVGWGVPVTNEYVESHFQDYLPQIRTALQKIPPGAWREFAAFAGPELSQLTAWEGKVALVGDASHALSGAFGSGAGFAMEDGWVLAQALARCANDGARALPLFDAVRRPYYHRMYEYLAAEGRRRRDEVAALGLGSAQEEEEGEEAARVRVKAVKSGTDMDWIYRHDIARVWERAVAEWQGGEEGEKGGAI